MTVGVNLVVVKMSTDNYHHGNLRQALLEEAGRVVKNEGAEAISFRSLARALGVSHAAPGHHFADRTALLSELAAQGYQELADAIELGMNRAASEQRLVAAGEAYVRFALANPEVYRMMFASRLLSGECSDNLLIASQRAYMLLLEAAHGRPPSGDPAAYRVATPELAAWSMVHGAVMLWLDGQLSATTTEEEFLDLVDRVLSLHFGQPGSSHVEERL